MKVKQAKNNDELNIKRNAFFFPSSCEVLPFRNSGTMFTASGTPRPHIKARGREKESTKSMHTRTTEQQERKGLLKRLSEAKCTQVSFTSSFCLVKERKADTE